MAAINAGFLKMGADKGLRINIKSTTTKRIKNSCCI
jgi:hypothetical protein